MISITTDDGEHFTLMVEGEEYTIDRNELVPFLAHAESLIEPTRELITVDEPE